VADANFVLSRGFIAEAAITKHRAVKAGAAAEGVTPVTAEGDAVLGVAQFDVTTAEIAQGKDCTVQMMGIVEMEAADQIVVGGLVGLASDGRAIASNTGARVLGICVGNPSGGAGDRISVLLSLPGIVAA